MSAPTDKAEAFRRAQAAELLDTVCGQAKRECAIPFVGLVDPISYGRIVDTIIGSDRGSISRIADPGENREIHPDYAAMTTDKDDDIEVKIVWQANAEVESEIRMMVADKFDQIRFTRFNPAVFGAHISGKKGYVMSLLDWTSDWFMSCRTEGTALPEDTTQP